MKISVIIPTLNRVICLQRLLNTVLKQTLKPHDVIIVDQSDNETIYDYFSEIKNTFKLYNIKLLYAKQCLKSSSIARNFGIVIATGDWLSFLDDDVVLDSNYYLEFNDYIKFNPAAVLLAGNMSNVRPACTFKEKTIDFIKKVFLMDRQSNEDGYIYPSFFGNQPAGFTEVKRCQWVSGGNSLVRASVAKDIKFDDKLISYSFAEDKDFSYRVFKRYPDSVYSLPGAKLEHLEEGGESRISPLRLYYMRTVYIYYFFFKNIEQTFLNRILFGWSRIGLLLSYSIPRIKFSHGIEFEYKLFKHLKSEFFALKHIKELKRQSLVFFNKWYYKQI